MLLALYTRCTNTPPLSYTSPCLVATPTQAHVTSHIEVVHALTGVLTVNLKGNTPRHKILFIYCVLKDTNKSCN